MLIVHKECGGAVSDRGVCERCGELLHARDARALPGPGVEAAGLGAEPREWQLFAHYRGSTMLQSTMMNPVSD